MSDNFTPRQPIDATDHTQQLGQNHRASKFPWPEVKSNESRLAADALDNILKDLEAELGE